MTDEVAGVEIAGLENDGLENYGLENDGVEQEETRIAYEDKNSSGDEIANVNFLRRYGTYVLQNTKKENLLRLTN